MKRYIAYYKEAETPRNVLNTDKLCNTFRPGPAIVIDYKLNRVCSWGLYPMSRQTWHVFKTISEALAYAKSIYLNQ